MKKIIHKDGYYYDLVRNNIKKFRTKKNMTQQELADLSGLSLNYISKIESTKMQRGFSLDTIGRIADALNIDIQYLFKK